MGYYVVCIPKAGNALHSHFPSSLPEGCDWVKRVPWYTDYGV